MAANEPKSLSAILKQTQSLLASSSVQQGQGPNDKESRSRKARELSKDISTYFKQTQSKHNSLPAGSSPAWWKAGPDDLYHPSMGLQRAGSVDGSSFRTERAPSPAPAVQPPPPSTVLPRAQPAPSRLSRTLPPLGGASTSQQPHPSPAPGRPAPPPPPLMEEPLVPPRPAFMRGPSAPRPAPPVPVGGHSMEHGLDASHRTPVMNDDKEAAELARALAESRALAERTETDQMEEDAALARALEESERQAFSEWQQPAQAPAPAPTPAPALATGGRSEADILAFRNEKGQIWREGGAHGWLPPGAARPQDQEERLEHETLALAIRLSLEDQAIQSHFGAADEREYSTRPPRRQAPPPPPHQQEPLGADAPMRPTRAAPPIPITEQPHRRPSYSRSQPSTETGSPEEIPQMAWFPPAESPASVDETVTEPGWTPPEQHQERVLAVTNPDVDEQQRPQLQSLAGRSMSHITERTEPESAAPSFMTEATENGGYSSYDDDAEYDFDIGSTDEERLNSSEDATIVRHPSGASGRVLQTTATAPVVPATAALTGSMAQGSGSVNNQEVAETVENGSSPLYGAGVRYGHPAKCAEHHACMHDGLHSEKPFPSLVELSTFPASGEEELKEGSNKFSIEAQTWAHLLRFILWEGETRLAASAQNVAAEETNHCDAAMSLEFRKDDEGSSVIRLTVELLAPDAPRPRQDLWISPSPASPKGKARQGATGEIMNLPDALVLPATLSSVAITLYTLRHLASIASSTQPSKDAATSYHALRALSQSIQRLAREHESGTSQADEDQDGARLLDKLRARLLRNKRRRRESAEVNGAKVARPNAWSDRVASRRQRSTAPQEQTPAVAIAPPRPIEEVTLSEAQTVQDMRYISRI